MTVTSITSKIGKNDINFYDGITDTFTRLTSTGGTLTCYKVGNEVDVCAVYGSNATKTGAILAEAISQAGTNQVVLLLSPGTWAVTANLTIPQTVTLKPVRGVDMTVATGVTVTHNGESRAGRYKWITLTGTGKVVMKGVVFPEWWGAIPDATTDSEPGIQDALESLTTGGTVSLDGGTYLLTTYLTHASLEWPDYDGITLAGLGMGATHLKGKDHASTDYRVINISASSSAGIYNPVIRDLTVTGTADQAAGPGEGITLGNYVYDALIERVEVRYVRGAALRHSTLTPGERHTVQHCYFHDNATTNMTAAGGGGSGILSCAPKTRWLYNRIINCGAGDALAHSIYGLQDDLQVIGNYVEGKAFDIRSGTYDGDNVIVSGNRVKVTDATDINSTIYTLENAIVTDNIFEGTFVTFQCDGGIFCNNKFLNSGLVVTTGYAHLNVNGENILVEGNSIYGKGTVTSSTGIQVGNIDDTHDNIRIVGNKIYDCFEALRINGAYDATNIEFIGNDCDGGANVTTTWLGVNIPAAAGTVNNIRVNRNTFRRYYIMADIRENINPAQFNDNTLVGVTYGLQVVVDPCAGIECIGTVGMDSTFANPFNATYSPSATRVFRMAGTRRVSDDGIITLTDTGTPYVWLGESFITGGTTPITNFLGGTVGKTITILGAHSVTITNGTPIKLAGAGNFSMTALDGLTLKMFSVGVWTEIARSVN